jgi:hypothetical protein
VPGKEGRQGLIVAASDVEKAGAVRRGGVHRQRGTWWPAATWGRALQHRRGRGRLFTEVEREEWGRSGTRNGKGAGGVTHSVTVEEGTRLGVTSRRVAMHVVSRGKLSVDRWAPVISGSEREDLTCGLLCKNLIISIFQIHSNLIRFKIDLPELEQLEIKYGCEYFELRNNVPYCNFSRFGMNFELKLI